MDISIEKGSWKTLEHPASAVRLMVFVAEQKVPKEEEIDALDPVSTHFVARDSRHMVVGTARSSSKQCSNAHARAASGR